MLDAAPQAGVYHRYRDLSGWRGQITGDCLYRGSAADGEDQSLRVAPPSAGTTMRKIWMCIDFLCKLVYCYL